MAPKQPPREMQILSLGLLRSGTLSMCRAYEQLGYQDVYHGMKSLDDNDDWLVLARGADASFPALPTYTGVSFTRADWDEVFGSSEAVTDVASLFGEQLVKVYPDAKVVLVQRDFDKWWASMEESVVSNFWGPVPDFIIGYVEPLLGTTGGMAGRKMLLGFFDAKDPEELRRNARTAWERHHARIRELVPKEQLLDFKMEDGWKPLCEFLGKPVPPPGIEFPWVNESAALKAKVIERHTQQLKDAGRRMAPWAAGLLAVGVGTWFAWGRIGGMGR